MDKIRKLLESQDRDDVIIGINLLSKIYSGNRFLDELQCITYKFEVPIWFMYGVTLVDIHSGHAFTDNSVKSLVIQSYAENHPEQKIEL